MGWIRLQQVKSLISRVPDAYLLGMWIGTISDLKKVLVQKTMNHFLNEIQKTDPKAIIILSSMGPVYLQGTPFKGKGKDRVKGLGVELITDRNITDRWTIYEVGMRNTLKELSDLTNSRVLFTIDVPELGIDRGCQKRPSKRILTPLFELTDSVSMGPRILTKDCYVSRSDYNQRSVRYKNLVRNIIKDFPNVKLFDPTSTFCDDVRCNGFSDKFSYLYKDIDHLSKSGSLLFAIKLRAFIEGV